MSRAAFLVPALVALLTRVLTGPRPIDDAYITFRYARNLAEGLGLVYNPGEWVLGTTTPLWALILSAGFTLGLTDLAWLSTAISALADAASAALLVRLGLRMGWPPLAAAFIGLAWALNPMSVAFASGGMETSLFVLAELGVLALAAQGRYLVMAAGLAGLATLVRPEGALLAAVVVGWTCVRSRRQTLLAGTVAAIAPGMAAIALFMRYGSPLPQSMAAKQVAYGPLGPFDNLLVLGVHAGLPGWSTYLLAAAPPLLAVSTALLGVVTLAYLSRHGLPWLQHQHVAWQPFAAFGLVYFGFYVVLGLRGVRLFNWYLVPLAPLYLLTAAAGLARLGRVRAPWFAGLLLLWQLPAIDWRQPFLPAGETLLREQLLLDVGQGLALSLPAGATIAAPEIGALGYGSNLRILDTVGLISPSALPYYPLPVEQLVTDNAVPSALIVDQQPEAVVTLDAYAQRTLLLDPTFQHEYHLERSYPAQVWQSQELLVFRRNRG